MNFEPPVSIKGVTDDELDLIRKALSVWHAKKPRNMVRETYYDGKIPVRDLGISTPPGVKQRVRAVLDWPQRACTMLAERSIFDGFAAPDMGEDPFELSELLDANRFDLDLPQAIVSTYKHSCSFLTTTSGDAASGEPKVIIRARAADTTGAVWDEHARRINAVVAVVETDQDGRPTELEAYLPGVVLLCKRRALGAWEADRRASPVELGPMADALTWDAQLGRPFGRSRISRAVMSTTDNALRTILRAEVSAEFYAAPRMMALGVAEDAFTKGKWQAAIDRWFALTRDEDGNVPEVKQFPQMTMEPLMALYRSYASQMQAASGIPISSLGIVTDNPTSAEAMFAAEKDLINMARVANRSHGFALKQVARKVLHLRDGAIPAEAAKLSAAWVNPAFTSQVTAADALTKLAAVFPWLGESDTALRFAGFTQAEIARLSADRRRAAGGSVLERVLGGETEPVQPDTAVEQPGEATPATPAQGGGE